MNDSDVSDGLEAKHAKNREQRLEAVKRWVEYIKTEPPETWGPQQNAVVNDQLEAAERAELSAGHRQHVKELARDIRRLRDDPEDHSN